MNRIQISLARNNVRSAIVAAQMRRRHSGVIHDGTEATEPPAAGVIGPPNPAEGEAQRLADKTVRADGIKPGGDMRLAGARDPRPDTDPTFDWVLGHKASIALRQHKGPRPEVALRGFKAAPVEVPQEAQAAQWNDGSARPPRFLRNTDGPMPPEERRRRQELNGLAGIGRGVTSPGGQPRGPAVARGSLSADQPHDPLASWRSSDSY